MARASWRSSSSKASEAHRHAVGLSDRGRALFRPKSLVFLLLELEQFDQITRRIFQEPGAARSRLADVAPEFGPSAAQPGDETIDVFRDDHEPVPPARLR